MVRLAAFLAILLVSASAQADTFDRLVGYECDSMNDRLIIRYKGAYNENGRALVEAKSATEWSPSLLIASMRDDDHIGSLRTVVRTCRLKHATYTIRLGPTPGNFNIQGECGGEITAWVEVRRGAKIVFPRYEFEGQCHDMDAPITTEISFDHAQSKPAITKISRDEFFK